MPPSLLLSLALFAGAPAQAQDPIAPVAPPAAADPADVTALYDTAFNALVHGDFATASITFSVVADRTVEPARKAAALELARASKALLDGKGAVATVPAPSTARVPRGDETEDGRSAFVASSTLASFYSSFLLIDFLGIDDEKGIIGFATGTTAVGFGASLVGTQYMDLSRGTASGFSVGLGVGLANGLGLGPIAGVHVEADDYQRDGNINQYWRLLGFATMAAGGAGGAKLASRYEVTPAQANFAGMMAFNGALTSAGMLLIFEDWSEEQDENLLLALPTLGLDAGLGAGLALLPRVDWSNSRMTYVTLSEFLGALCGVTAAVLGEYDDPGVAVAVLSGVWLGAGTGAYLTRDMAPNDRLSPRYTKQANLRLSPMPTEKGGMGVGISGAF